MLTRSLLLVSLLVGPWFLAPPAQCGEPGLTATRVASIAAADVPDHSTGAPQPHVTMLPSDLEFFPDGSGHALLVMNTGSIAWLDGNFSVRGVFTVPSANSLASFRRTDTLFDNEGVLGLVFDPGFAGNGHFYVHLNPAPKAGIEIWRLTWNPQDLGAIWDSRRLVFATEKPQIATSEAHLHNHNGGNPSFGPDGFLYVTLGDGGIGGFDYRNNEAQSLSSFWGKAIRIDPEGRASPRGLRNPFTHTWFGDTMLIGDVGGDYARHWEEINAYALADTDAGNVPNYGWPVVPGPCLEHEDGNTCKAFRDPLHGYAKADARFIAEDPESVPPAEGTVNRSSVIVGPVVTGPAYGAALVDTLVYADVFQGWVRGAWLGGDGALLADNHLLHMPEPVIGITTGPDGLLYLLAGFGEAVSIYRVDAAGTTGEEPDAGPSGVSLLDDPLQPLPKRLSDTGLFVDADTLGADSRALPFEPDHPLWTDGADKARWMVLPAGGVIDTSRPDDWAFPVGTLFFKHFSYRPGGSEASRRDVETRVLQKLADGWHAGVYQWREDGSDADRTAGLPLKVALRAGELALGRDVDYVIPGRAQCLGCHERAGDFVIGFEAVQLSGSAAGRRTLQALAAAGRFSHVDAAPWPTIAGTSEVEQRARGYLHGNCAHCHSGEGGLGTLGFSLRHDQTRSLIGRQSVRSQVALLQAGDPDSSAILAMMAGTPGYARMPPLGTSIADEAGLDAVRRWIASMPVAAQAAEAGGATDVVEFYNRGLDHYFITPDAGEREAILEGKAGPGWRLTGYRFRAWPADASPAVAAPVCRFYGTPGVGPNSHFFSGASGECEQVAGDPGWTLEQRHAFGIMTPRAGRCPENSDAVYRFYNGRYPVNDSNHRYVVDLSVREAMREQGWLDEGVKLCAPR